MSRGPGKLQKRILRQLFEAPGGRLARDDLRRGYPFETHDKSWYRSIRSLKKKGEIEDFEIGGRRYIALPPGKCREDEELIAMTRMLTNNVAELARARGLPEFAVRKIVNGADPNEFRHLVFSNEDTGEG